MSNCLENWNFKTYFWSKFFFSHPVLLCTPQWHKSSNHTGYNRKVMHHEVKKSQVLHYSFYSTSFSSIKELLTLYKANWNEISNFTKGAFVNVIYAPKWTLNFQKFLLYETQGLGSTTSGIFNLNFRVMKNRFFLQLLFFLKRPLPSLESYTPLLNNPIQIS